MIRRTRRGLRVRAATLPLRMRLVAGFSVAIIVVLGAAGAFVYWRVSYALDARLNNDARDAFATLSPLVTPAGTLRTDPNIIGSSAGRQYQVVDLDGHVLSYGAEVGPTALLPPATVRQALDGPVTVNLGAFLPRSDRPLRVLAVRLDKLGNPARFLIVAIRRDQRDEALRELLAQLTVAGFGALVVTAVVGERLAKAALAPVERYRRQAARIARGATGVRLDVPAQRDDEVTRLGQMLNTMLDALEENVERERRFTQDASHELRTPLTLLSTRVQLALRRPRSNEALQATLAELGRDIDGLSQLADDLLSLSAARDDRADQSLSLAEAHELIQVVLGGNPDVQADVRDLADVRSETTVPLGAQQLRQVLTNLLANAVTHGTAPVDLSATLQEEGRYLRFTITDHGPGMPAAFLPLAIERFARADDARDRPGAGLGLALVQALVDPVGGELRLCVDGTHQGYSHHIDVPCHHPDQGTAATVLLPVSTPARPRP